MIRTKLAKKLLTKKEQTHLTKCANVHSMEGLKRTRDGQIAMVNESKSLGHTHVEPCFECKHIAKKLGLNKKS